MRKPFLIPIIFVMLAFTAQGCAPSKSLLSRISLEMNKPQILDKMGDPLVVRGSIKNKYGQFVEVWEYRLCSGGEVDIAPYSKNCDLYWLYFVDGSLAQWGQAGDWRKEADRIYEYRIR